MPMVGLMVSPNEGKRKQMDQQLIVMGKGLPSLPSLLLIFSFLDLELLPSSLNGHSSSFHRCTKSKAKPAMARMNSTSFVHRFYTHQVIPELAMEGATCRLLVLLTLLVIIPVATPTLAILMRCGKSERRKPRRPPLKPIIPILRKSQIVSTRMSTSKYSIFHNLISIIFIFHLLRINQLYLVWKM